MPVLAERERDHVRGIGHLARELDHSLHGIRSGGGRELQFIAKPAQREYEVTESPDELSLRSRREIWTMDDVIAREVVHKSLRGVRVVMPSIEGCGPGEEVKVVDTVLADLERAMRGVESDGE